MKVRLSLPVSKLFAFDRNYVLRKQILFWAIHELFRLHANLFSRKHKQLLHMFCKTATVFLFVCLHVFKKIIVGHQNVCESQSCLTQRFNRSFIHPFIYLFRFF